VYHTRPATDSDGDSDGAGTQPHKRPHKGLGPARAGYEWVTWFVVPGEGGGMGIALSVILVAIGAIIKFGLNFNIRFVDDDTVGMILMIVGGLGLIVAIIASRGRRNQQVVINEPAGRRPDDRSRARGPD
jgi:hypothetical protein